ncbi:MAG: hypothetical protein IKI88_03370 [Anaerotignum sp.]|nr:hypothetical protein [Anaerotignum sp.]
MREQERKDWQRFMQTGQVEDYLRYRQRAANREPNPRRRIAESSKYKQFY